MCDHTASSVPLGAVATAPGTSLKSKRVLGSTVPSARTVRAYTNESQSPDVLGVWASQSVLHNGHWAFTKQHRWSRSAYDQPVGAYRFDDGHLSVVYTTWRTDVTE